MALANCHCREEGPSAALLAELPPKVHHRDCPETGVQTYKGPSVSNIKVLPRGVVSSMSSKHPLVVLIMTSRGSPG